MEQIFKGTINGKEYTDYGEFTSALAKIDNSDSYCVTTTFMTEDRSEDNKQLDMEDKCEKRLGCSCCDEEKEYEFDAEKYIPNLDAIMDAAEEGENLDSLYEDFGEKIDEINRLDEDKKRALIVKMDEFLPKLHKYIHESESLRDERKRQNNAITKDLEDARNRVNELEKASLMSAKNLALATLSYDALTKVLGYVNSVIPDADTEKHCDSEDDKSHSIDKWSDDVVEYVKRFFPLDRINSLEKRLKDMDDEEKRRNSKALGYYPFPSQKWKNDFQKFITEMFNF